MLGARRSDLDDTSAVLWVRNRVQDDYQPQVGMANEVRTLELEKLPYRLDILDVVVNASMQHGAITYRC